MPNNPKMDSCSGQQSWNRIKHPALALPRFSLMELGFLAETSLVVAATPLISNELVPNTASNTLCVSSNTGHTAYRYCNLQMGLTSSMRRFTVA